MDFPCRLPVLAGTILCSIAALPAGAQTYRPDAEGYPCTRSAQLTIVQDDTGYLIREKIERPAPLVSKTAIKLGNSLAIDAQVFARTSLIRLESNNASER